MRVMSKQTRALLVATLTADALRATLAAEQCTALTQNILTSVGCPSSCQENPCVLYSPSLSSSSSSGTNNASDTACKGTDAAGECLTEEAFIVPGTSVECELTYQCLDSLVDEQTMKWFLTLNMGNTRENEITTASVTEIKSLTYPSDVATVQLAGGVRSTKKGQVKNVVMDESFFATPSTVKTMFLSDLNLRTIVSKIPFSSSWSKVALNNANLDHVPDALATLSLDYIALSNNFMTAISNASLEMNKAFSTASTVLLDGNDLTSFEMNLPNATTLNLTDNPLDHVPLVIFSMEKLTSLAMQRCDLNNVALTQDQFDFLDRVPTLDASFTASNCATGAMDRSLSGGQGSVCVLGASSNTSGGHTGAIAGGVSAGVLVVGLIGYFYCRRHRPQHDIMPDLDKTTDATYSDADVYCGGNNNAAIIWNDPDLLLVRIEYEAVTRVKLLSRGGFGEVWLGLYMNQNVAIKSLLPGKKTMSDAVAFASEIKLMARLDHPKIVEFIGVAWTNVLTIQAVTEFMDCGDLRQLLDSSRASTLTWSNLKCQIAIDVADALVYLHTLSPKIIHRDLKARNVLIDAESGAKLSDFGISRTRSNTTETMTAGIGTSRWIAPEVILGGHYTEFADIYSFGVVLSELDTTKSPFHNATNTNGSKLQDVTIVQLVSAGKLQPSFERDCPSEIVTLAKKCLSYDPAQRPSAIQIAYELRKILKDES